VLSPRRSCHLKWVSELLDEQGMWKTELVRHIFYPIDADVILGIKPARQFDDILAWQLEKSGIFSVKRPGRLTMHCYASAEEALVLARGRRNRRGGTAFRETESSNAVCQT
jgi:hypothetical protein